MPKVGISTHRRTKSVCVHIIGWLVEVVAGDDKCGKRRVIILLYLGVIIENQRIM